MDWISTFINHAHEMEKNSTDLLALRIRSLIADKEMVTATANLDIKRGGEWRCDYQAWYREIDAKIEALFSEANDEVHARHGREQSN